eukprot:jgi/Botrbrau1/12253/Bobra.0361s0014.1
MLPYEQDIQTVLNVSMNHLDSNAKFELGLPCPTASQRREPCLSDLLRPPGQGLHASMAELHQLAEAMGCTTDCVLSHSLNSRAIQALESASDPSLLRGACTAADTKPGDAREEEPLHRDRTLTPTRQMGSGRKRDLLDVETPFSSDVAQLQSDVAQLQSDVAQLQSENQALRRQLAHALQEKSNLSGMVDKLQLEIRRLSAGSIGESLPGDRSYSRRSSFGEEEVLEKVQTFDGADLSWAMPPTPTSGPDSAPKDDMLGLSLGTPAQPLPKRPFNYRSSLPNQFFYWEWPTHSSVAESPPAKGPSGKAAKKLKRVTSFGGM